MLLGDHAIDTVVHLAAIVDPPPGMDAATLHDIEVGGTRRVPEACVVAGVTPASPPASTRRRSKPCRARPGSGTPSSPTETEMATQALCDVAPPVATTLIACARETGSVAPQGV